MLQLKKVWFKVLLKETDMYALMIHRVSALWSRAKPSLKLQMLWLQVCENSKKVFVIDRFVITTVEGNKLQIKK